MDIERQLEKVVKADIPFALHSLRPGTRGALRGYEHTGLEWPDQEQSKPSKRQVVSEIKRLKALKEHLKYRRDRIPEYLPIDVQLDLLYWDKINGTDNWINHVTSVKEKFPKPE